MASLYCLLSGSGSLLLLILSTDDLNKTIVIIRPAETPIVIIRPAETPESWNIEHQLDCIFADNDIIKMSTNIW